jgi:hypothetical protein
MDIGWDFINAWLYIYIYIYIYKIDCFFMNEWLKLIIWQKKGYFRKKKLDSKMIVLTCKKHLTLCGIDHAYLLMENYGLMS